RAIVGTLTACRSLIASSLMDAPPGPQSASNSKRLRRRRRTPVCLLDSPASKAVRSAELRHTVYFLLTDRPPNAVMLVPNSLGASQLFPIVNNWIDRLSKSVRQWQSAFN